MKSPPATRLGTTQLERAARVLHALAHPLRLDVMQTLAANGELACNELQRQAGCSQSMLSQQLKLLETHGLVACRKQGALKLVRIRNPDILNLFACMRHHLDLLAADGAAAATATGPDLKES